MSNCQNCFNGCAEIISDRCIRYTGIDIPTLGIQTGDNLSSVEQSLTTFLVSALNGTGIKIDLSSITICSLVRSYLPVCGDITIVDISKALIQSACSLQAQVTNLSDTINILNADYDKACLAGVTDSSDTHAIVQATINAVCALTDDFTDLVTSLPLTYVKLVDLNTLIQNYLNSQGTTTKYYNRMIPYAVVEYYGPIAGNFDGTGKGIASGPWEKIYLCNGINGTPDKRGVVGVGVTDGSMLGGTLPPATIPNSTNPNYTLSGTIVGVNSVTLGLNQIPSHTHTATVHDSGHSHTISGTTHNASGPGSESVLNPGSSSFSTSTNTTGITVTNDYQGGNQGHVNYQPGLGCYYIQYRP